MNVEQIVLLATWLLSSGVLIGCGIVLFRRKVGRNHWFGFRTKLTMRDDEIWYAANHVAGRWLIITGVGTALSVTVAILAGMNDVESSTLIIGGLLTGISVCVVASFAEQQRIVEERERTDLNQGETQRG